MADKQLSGKASKLVQDLSYLPNIVGAMGLSIAAAQKAFNLDYMESVERLLAIAKTLMGEQQNSEIITALRKAQIAAAQAAEGDDDDKAQEAWEAAKAAIQKVHDEATLRLEAAREAFANATPENRAARQAARDEAAKAVKGVDAALEAADEGTTALEKAAAAARGATAAAQAAAQLIQQLTGAELERARAFSDIFQHLIVALAPPRYQFSETTLSVRMDLAQSLKMAGALELGVDLKALTVSAAASATYGYDYRAAAEVKTVIHASLPNDKLFESLLSRSKELHEKSLQLPALSAVDQKLIEQAGSIFESVTGAKPPEPTSEEEGAAGETA